MHRGRRSHTRPSGFSKKRFFRAMRIGVEQMIQAEVSSTLKKILKQNQVSENYLTGNELSAMINKCLTEVQVTSAVPSATSFDADELNVDNDSNSMRQRFVELQESIDAIEGNCLDLLKAITGIDVKKTPEVEIDYDLLKLQVCKYIERIRALKDFEGHKAETAESAAEKICDDQKDCAVANNINVISVSPAQLNHTQNDEHEHIRINDAHVVCHTPSVSSKSGDDGLQVIELVSPHKLHFTPVASEFEDEQAAMDVVAQAAAEVEVQVSDANAIANALVHEHLNSYERMIRQHRQLALNVLVYKKSEATMDINKERGYNEYWLNKTFLDETTPSKLELQHD